MAEEERVLPFEPHGLEHGVLFGGPGVQRNGNGGDRPLGARNGQARPGRTRGPHGPGLLDGALFGQRAHGPGLAAHAQSLPAGPTGRFAVLAVALPKEAPHQALGDLLTLAQLVLRVAVLALLVEERGLLVHDLELARVNISGGLYDSIAGGLLEDSVDPIEIVDGLTDRYDRLWAELTREDEIDAAERWRIGRRIERLNEMGFDVEELSVAQSSDGSRLRIRPIVVEEGHAHLRLRRLTGLEVQENQARTLLNALDAYGLYLEKIAGNSIPEAVKAYRWLAERYEPVVVAIPAAYRDRLDDAQLIYEFIEHRSAKSKAAGRQIENDEALPSFISEVLENLPPEKTLIDDDNENDPYDALLLGESPPPDIPDAQ